LTVEQCAEVLDSGQPRFRNRVVGQSHL
jgi:hypothetical protein